MATPTTHPLIFVSGPASSGKSEWAESLAAHSGYEVHYIATACLDPNDSEWLQKIHRHQARRPPHWTTLQVPIDLPAAINNTPQSCCLLIDSLGTWVANLLEVDNHQWGKKVDQLILALRQTTAMTIIVAEETNWGIVPQYHSARLFRNRLGPLNRLIAASAQHVYLVVAGHALDLRVLGQSINPTTIESDAGFRENVDSQNSSMPDFARLTTLR